ncbi:MAG: hypothetical protein J4G10_04820 [Alphaproteobacteria bacterium]|nr:hypothetical protein [Alphaproteobacteria bacterium]
MDALKSVVRWVGQITEVGLGLIALGIVVQILFGAKATFLTGDIVGNLIALIRALGDNGLVGLIALGIILYLYNKSRE